MSKKKSTPLSKENAAKVKSLAAVALSDKTPTVEEVDTIVDTLSGIVEPVETVNIQRIRNGEWREVLQELGSIEYNRIRLLALK